MRKSDYETWWRKGSDVTSELITRGKRNKDQEGFGMNWEKQLTTSFLKFVLHYLFRGFFHQSVEYTTCQFKYYGCYTCLKKGYDKSK